MSQFWHFTSQPAGLFLLAKRCASVCLSEKIQDCILMCASPTPCHSHICILSNKSNNNTDRVLHFERVAGPAFGAVQGLHRRLGPVWSDGFGLMTLFWSGDGIVWIKNMWICKWESECPRNQIREVMDPPLDIKRLRTEYKKGPRERTCASKPVSRQKSG